MKSEDIFASYKDNIMPTYNKTPVIFVKGKGSRLWDIKGKAYLDFFPGWGVGSVGHCHPKVMQGIRDQVGKLIFIPNNYYHPFQARLAEELIRWSFPGKVFFANSGAEANEGAIKLARKSGARSGKFEIITFQNAFHGRTLATLAATGQKKYQDGFLPMPEGFRQVSFNDTAAFRSALNDKTAAVMLELIQGEGGLNVATKDFVLEIRRVCDERKLLLIVDEVQTGIGRTGSMFCYQNYGITPDIMTLAKALGGGMPIGAMVAKREIADLLTPGMHASTFGGGPVVCKASLGVFKAIRQDKMLQNCLKMGEYFKDKLHSLKESSPLIKDVRGMGLMLGFELNLPGRQLVEKCLERGLLINCTHERVIRLMPALNISKSDIDKCLKIIEQSLKECS
ncbi:MAG: aspartate aminotransferase family protein [Candidatus Omnitrophica bacterium]|nr:aspartate aminotransferase family protein [Candidatus Omnitrophota bacterium]